MLLPVADATCLTERSSAASAPNWSAPVEGSTSSQERDPPSLSQCYRLLRAVDGWRGNAMPIPGFTADHATLAGRGNYCAAFLPSATGGVIPQLPIGPIGNGLGNCCCVDWIGFGGINVSMASVAPAGGPVIIGPFRVQCTECPQGDDDCQCSCSEGGVPCAQRGNTTVCEPG